ncbi:MAG TPA: cytidine deaminase [Vicinamibacterales bacterium]|nr:cytidine deaminase [Vicinamibacterales bacterium]
MIDFENARLSVTLVDVNRGQESEFRNLMARYERLLMSKGYGRAELIRDEAVPGRYYSVRYWTDATCAERCHADADVREVTAKVYVLARISHVVNGAKKPDPLRLVLDDRRMRIESDRRTGFDRRVRNLGRTDGDRRVPADRRVGPRRLREQPDGVDLVGAARRARERADAAFSHFKVGAALQAADGSVITGCNVENATYGLTMCAERVAMFKALSEGHRAFTRVAVVADTASPTPPCGACRQILWEFGGNLEVVLANLTDVIGTHQLKDLLPLPFDARLL